MKNNLKFLSIALAAFALGLGTSNYVMSDTPASFKVAVVNVPKIVESSAQVKALKEENSKNVMELAKLGETAQKAIEKEKDAKKQFVIFIIFSVIGLLINDLIMLVSVDFLHVYYLLAKIIATAVVMVFNFVTRKMFLE